MESHKYNFSKSGVQVGFFINWEEFKFTATIIGNQTILRRIRLGQEFRGFQKVRAGSKPQFDLCMTRIFWFPTLKGRRYTQFHKLLIWDQEIDWYATERECKTCSESTEIIGFLFSWIVVGNLCFWWNRTIKVCIIGNNYCYNQAIVQAFGDANSKF